MEQNYSKKKPQTSTDGPSDLSVKRILAFSKAFKTLNTSDDLLKLKK
jgi:hypothetical protein